MIPKKFIREYGSSLSNPMFLVGKLMIPKKFTKKYGASLSNPVFLKVPDGIEWEICWTKSGVGDVWLEKDWKEFVAYYSIVHGHHLLIFKFQQTFKWGIHILDTSVSLQQH